MEFTDWEPIYGAILADFGYDRAADEAVRDRAAAHAAPFDLARLDSASDTVAVAGAGPSLEADAALAREADRVFAASTATDRLAALGVDADAMVTDLDKNPDTGLARTERGAVVVAHAHGDNGALVEEWLPRYDAANTLVTTQAAPVDAVANYGGFTDGDRAAFLADACGAERLVFPGWDFDDPDVDATKARKLGWAERLLRLLERRRGERFAVLDGRRDGIEPI
ncbi:6-hydroxymethylpterin diphosphokinase MptE-like protein [Halobaculum lipolyticum]|uniref:6-hydroxymethyl-7,8-dihydropterin pyrophosphokinase n=1 Tax=Halobaculum lipolyticum TaxID=3032001 RepID=A0ABD5WGQ4_9EURY|nr:6-hydroxymethylpterin diphosphokinase MptE-like protein [Halobaculum sp. DT31]